MDLAVVVGGGGGQWCFWGDGGICGGLVVVEVAW